MFKTKFLIIIIWSINISHCLNNSLIYNSLGSLLNFLSFLSLLVFPRESLNLLHWEFGFQLKLWWYFLFFFLFLFVFLFVVVINVALSITRGTGLCS